MLLSGDDFGLLSAVEKISNAEKRHAETTRDMLAEEMWTQYQQILAERSMQGEVDDGTDVDIEIAPLD